MSKDLDYERIIREIRLDRQMKKKRLYEQAKRTSTLTPKAKPSRSCG